MWWEVQAAAMFWLSMCQNLQDLEVVRGNKPVPDKRQETVTGDAVKPAAASVFGRIQAPRKVFETYDSVKKKKQGKKKSEYPHK